MGFNDRLIPIIENVNDVPSEVNTEYYPNASILIDKYNGLITDVLPFISNDSSGSGTSYITHREEFPLSVSGITLFLDTSLTFSTSNTFHTVANLVGFLNNKIFSEPIHLVINTDVNLGTFIINSIFVNNTDELLISKTDPDLDVSFEYLHSTLRLRFDYFFTNKRPSYEDPVNGTQAARDINLNCSSTDIIFESGFKVTAAHSFDRCTVVFEQELSCNTSPYFERIQFNNCQVTLKNIDDTGAAYSYISTNFWLYYGSLTFDSCNIDVEKWGSMSINNSNVFIINSTFIKARNSAGSTWTPYINDSRIVAINSTFTRINLNPFNIGGRVFRCVGYFKGCTGGQTVSSNNYIYLIST